MKGRHKARIIAMRVLFQRDIGGRPPAESLAEEIAGVRPEVAEYARELVEGTLEHLDEIDRTLGELAEGWGTERMAAVDRSVLRIGVYELSHRRDVPAAVVINEAVELAKTYSTADSGRFVNGVLAGVLRQKA